MTAKQHTYLREKYTKTNTNNSQLLQADTKLNICNFTYYLLSKNSESIL